jgi:hypothetical protein
VRRFKSLKPSHKGWDHSPPLKHQPDHAKELNKSFEMGLLCCCDAGGRGGGVTPLGLQQAWQLREMRQSYSHNGRVHVGWYLASS